MAERQFGPYRLVRQIAVGGMAEIHLAKTKGIAGFEKYVALKMIHPNFAEDEQFIQMLVDEAKIAVQLTHGNIAQTFDLGRVGETYYITMEYVDGADLYKILRKGSEQDIEMPLDVCAFVAKEMTSALDHAHRKKDHAGRPLGIVHRDVSPQNVLVSFSGEVKLVDFGIAKATMKARQTAVGVIKGKYYYMSPEQAWGDKIDFRSDIFSAGIVLYEMITGQMLYLEEDLHKLLDMARKAEIEPPSKLRKGVPPQLEKIVMHALQKKAEDRYQSAGDFASDLERFLHAYSPVFTASKVSGLLKKIVGDPMQVPAAADFPDIEIHEGANATFTLDTADLLHDRGELQDENSVIFRVNDLKKPAPAKPPEKKQVSPKAPGNFTRATAPTEPPPIAGPGAAQKPPTGNPGAAMSIPKITAPAKQPARAPVVRPPTKPRHADEQTREVQPAPPGPDDDGSGLLTPQGAKVSPRPWESVDDDLENIGERTMITANPGAGNFMMDSDEPVDATLISSAPRPDTDEESTEPGDEPAHDGEDEEGPTLARDFTDKPKAKTRRQPAPAALSANIHAPAVSELRRPKPSRRTPPGGVPVQGNVLQQIVGKQASEPMPVPREQPPPPPQPPPPSQFPQATPGGQAPYMSDASGMPMGGDYQQGQPGYPSQGYPQQPGSPPYPPQGYAPQPGYPPQGGPPQGYPPQPGYPPQGYAPQGGPGYPQQPGYPPQGYPPQPGYPPQGYPPGYPPPQGYAPPPDQGQVTPGALYQFQPGTKPMSLTGQLRLFEVDEMPSQYNLGASRRRWFTYIVAGLIAISVAGGATALIVRATRDSAPTVGSVHVESVPAGAEVTFDGTRMSDKTPLTITGIPVGSKHDIKVELARHKPYTDTVDIPRNGGEVPVMALLKPVTGKLLINSVPKDAEIWMNGRNVGRTPITLNDVDMDSSRRVELRLKDHQPFIQDLTWPSNGQITIDAKLLK